MPDGDTPSGYVRVTAGRCVAVARETHAEDARLMLAEGSLYEAAARDLTARPMQGRGVAYAIALPATGMRAVVRHNRHGGLLARLTRDLFLPPTRAPHELAVALRLRELGVPTPDVLMYGTAPAPLLFRRADVVTREIESGRDLASYMAPEASSVDRASAWTATRELVRAMNEAGVRHHDLNVKNVLLAPSQDGLSAYLLDVDRVTFGGGG
jgi:3-deoxy-D-manno-octulosonic acid kinase